MESIILTTQTGDSFSVDVVRYFENAGRNYLIFTTNEKDNQGYVKLYAVRVDYNENGSASASNIADENEWTAVKGAIQTIINNIRNQIPIDFDLDISKLTSLKATSSRVFRLQEGSAKILASNKNPRVEQANTVIPEVPVNVPEPTVVAQPEPVNPVEEASVTPVTESSAIANSDETQHLKDEIERLTAENLLYRAKLDALKELLNKE